MKAHLQVIFEISGERSANSSLDTFAILTAAVRNGVYAANQFLASEGHTLRLNLEGEKSETQAGR